jgi:predicted DNA-binding transcriptional regulator AlpA
MKSKRYFAPAPVDQRSWPSAPVHARHGELLTEGDVAQFLRISPETLRYWRKTAQRRGPPFVKIERRLVRYRLADLEAYLKGRTARRSARK